jgi:hypothetical protein
MTARAEAHHELHVVAAPKHYARYFNDAAFKPIPADH